MKIDWNERRILDLRTRLAELEKENAELKKQIIGNTLSVRFPFPTPDPRNLRDQAIALLEKENAELTAKVAGLEKVISNSAIDEAGTIRQQISDYLELDRKYDNLKSRLAAALEIIAELEWQGNIMCCYFCGMEPEYGHKPDCKIAALKE